MLCMETDAEAGAGVESAHTTDRMSARSGRIEVITRGERRRRWSVEQKREIAAASLEPGVSPITVARRYGISSGLLYTWRRHLLEGSLGTAAQPAAKFARVEVTEPEERWWLYTMTAAATGLAHQTGMGWRGALRQALCFGTRSDAFHLGAVAGRGSLEPRALAHETPKPKRPGRQKLRTQDDGELLF